MSRPGGSLATVRLIAAREISTRVRERSFQISGALTIVLVAAISLLPTVFGPGTDVLLATDDRGERVARAAAEAAQAIDRDVEVRRVEPRAAQAALAEGTGDLVVSAAGLHAQDDPDDALVALVQDANARFATAEALQRQGLSPAEVTAALSPPPLEVAVAEPRDPQADARAGIAFLAVLLLYIQLLTFGYFVASGVVEEKASRVVELLLAAVRPRELLAGKVLGIGLLGFGQLIVIAAVGLAAGSASGVLDLDADVISAVALAVGWFVLGYAFYAGLFACAGALVPRQEELQSVTTPLTLTILVCFFMAFGVLQDPDGTLAHVSAYLPPIAPMTLPPRIALGEAPVHEIVAGAAITIAATLALIPLAARIYSGALLGTRTRVKLRDAWSAQAQRAPAGS